MPKELEISPGVYERIPNLVIISGSATLGKPDPDGISFYLNKSWTELSIYMRSHEGSTHPLIAMWLEEFKRIKISTKEFPPSIHALAKRSRQIDSPFRINPVVDTYNAVSMDLLLPLGAFDSGTVDGGLKLRLSHGGEEFTPIGKNVSLPTLRGEIVYSDDVSVLTRQFLWQQSDKGKITGATREIVFVCELLSDMGQDLIDKALHKIEDKFVTLLGGNVELSVQRK
jgi:DNA/RNA-binding domain of Phe-tRNA-synthetase-like protein